VGAGDVAAAAARLSAECIQVTFKTPTRLKAEAALRSRPEFHVLVRALLRRASSLAYFHHDCRLELDYREWIRAAREVNLVSDETRWVSWSRYSNRQRARIDLGGVLGRAVYEGEFGRFRELLVLGSLVHAGKNTTFGLGRYSVDIPEEGGVKNVRSAGLGGEKS
jgi:CRISPR/Cas system endoribonuclease Cas6 (RAMP superfamily)